VRGVVRPTYAKNKGQKMKAKEEKLRFTSTGTTLEGKR